MTSPTAQSTAPQGKAGTPPILRIDTGWPATEESPNWVAICAAEWSGPHDYFSLSGHIGKQWGEYVVDAVNQHEALLRERDELRKAFGCHAFASSDKHLSGYRLTIGFDTLDQVQAAHQAIANLGKALKAELEGK